MRKYSKHFELSSNDYKIIETIKLLNDKGIYPLPEGVYHILIGDSREEFLEFENLDTYKTLISYSSKKISTFIMMLVRYHYLEKIYDEESNNLYLKVTIQGELALEEYRKKHRYSFKKRKVKTSNLFLRTNKAEEKE